MLKLRKNRKGFTLTELMVVVVIIGILTAIAIPVYNSVTANAEQKACQANQRIIVESITMWQAANGTDLTDCDHADFTEGTGALNGFMQFPVTNKCGCTYSVTDGKLTVTYGSNVDDHAIVGATGVAGGGE